MFAVHQSAIRNTHAHELHAATGLRAVRYIVDPRALTKTVLAGEHADSDVCELALLDGGGGELGSNPDGSVGVCGEGVPTGDGGGVGGDWACDVDAPGDSEGVCLGNGGGNSSREGAGSEERGEDELGKHCS